MAGNSDQKTAEKVLKKLRSAGHKAYFAGGCVRDMLLNLESTDYDIATDASPQQVSDIFPRTIMVGARFGVAMVATRGKDGNDQIVEVTTFRDDLSYSDGRRPDGVRFVSPEEDASRRDFTINGMFYDPVSDEIIDYVGGREDLDKGILRTIGTPEKRFAEDYLRMLRAVRFASRLEFTLKDHTREEIIRNASKITSISGERIYEEIGLTLGSKNRLKGLVMLRELGLAEHILPELFGKQALWTDATERVAALPAESSLQKAFGALLMDLSLEQLRKIAGNWGASNQWRDTLIYFTVHRDTWKTAEDIDLCKLKRMMWNHNWQELLVLWKIREKIETGSTDLCNKIINKAGSIHPDKIHPKPFVNGEDLKSLGLKQGRRLGRILKELYDSQLNEQLDSREKAMKMAKTKIKKD